jgi:hypothetical protein
MPATYFPGPNHIIFIIIIIIVCDIYRCVQYLDYILWHGAGIVKSEYKFFARQRLGKHIPTAMNTQATVEYFPPL